VIRAADRAELSSLKGELREKTNEIADLHAAVNAEVDLTKKLEAELAAAHRIDSPITAVAPPKVLQDVGDDIPDFLDRRPLSPEDETHFAAVIAAWNNIVPELTRTLNSVPTIVRERFIAEVPRLLRLR
jgi:hypothetical protein